MVPFIGRGKKGSYIKFGENYLFDRLPEGFLLKEELPPAVKRVCDAMVRICGVDEQKCISIGTGFVVGECHCLTALHVIKDVESFNIKHGECVIGTREIDRDESVDLALLECEKLLIAPSVTLAEGDGLGRGELYALGHLFFIEASKGKTSTYESRMCAYKIKRNAFRKIEGDKFIVVIPSSMRDFFRGFSGGALVDSRGVVRGMLQATAIARFPSRSCLVGVRSYPMRDFLKRVSVP